MGYADYNYYCGVFGGEDVPEKAFTRLAAYCAGQMAYWTLNRVALYEAKDGAEPPREIRDCLCALVENAYREEEYVKGRIKSESVGSYAVAYELGGGQPAGAEAICRQYLSRVTGPDGKPLSLMYRGREGKPHGR